MYLTQSRLAFFGRTFHSERFSTGSRVSPLLLPEIHLRRPISFENGIGKPADLCSYAMSSCPNSLLAISMSNLRLAFETESAPYGEESLSLVNDQLDPEMGYVAIEQSFGSSHAVEPAQSLHPEAAGLTEADVMWLRTENADNKAKSGNLQDLKMQNGEKMRTLLVRPYPHEEFANATGIGTDSADVPNNSDTNMDCDPKSTSYADSVIATTALNAMLIDFNDLPTSWFDSD